MGSGRPTGCWPRRLPRLLAHAVTAAVFVAAAVLLTQDVVVDGFLDWANRRFAAADTTTPAGVVAPTTPTASGSPASLVPWATLGEYGRGFVAGSTTPAELRAFHGPEREVLEPIRVYAGLRSAGSPDQRAALAVRELERTGAFEREILGVVTTTGTGWVDPNAASSLEYLHGGDTALVGLQYSYLPSWISFLVDRDEAAEAGVALYRHVHRRWSQLPAERRPKLVIFGESLGSFGAEAPFRGGDAAASLANLVAGSDGALFTGPTASNHIWSQLTGDREPGSPVWRPVYGGGAEVQFANRPADLERPDQDWRHPRVLYVHHPSDPVGNATLESLWRRPGVDRPPQGLRRPGPGRLVPDRHRAPGGGRPHRRLQRRLRPRPQLRHRLRGRLGGRGPPGRVDARRQRPPPAPPPTRVGPMAAELSRDTIATAAVFGFFASAWFGWAQDQPPPAWRRWLVAGSILSLLTAVAGGVLTWRHWTDPTAFDADTSRTFGIVVGVEFALAGLGPPSWPGAAAATSSPPGSPWSSGSTSSRWPGCSGTRSSAWPAPW